MHSAMPNTDSVPQVAASGVVATMLAKQATIEKLKEAFVDLNKLAMLYSVTIKAAISSINEDCGVTADTMELMEKAANSGDDIMAAIWANMGVNPDEALAAGTMKLNELTGRA